MIIRVWARGLGVWGLEVVERVGGNSFGMGGDRLGGGWAKSSEGRRRVMAKVGFD